MNKSLIVIVIVLISNILSYSIGYTKAKQETKNLQKFLELDIQRVALNK